MNSTYLWLKVLHVLGAILFLGNIMVSAWWKVMADRTRNPMVIQFAHRQVIYTDIIFTAVGAGLLVTTGVANATLHQLPMSQTWLATGSMLFTVSGLIWLFILIPIQVAQSRITRSFRPDGIIPARYWQFARLWTAFGLLATVLPLWALYWMVFKPA